MKAAFFLTLLWASMLGAQTEGPSKSPTIPPFSGTWMLNLQRSSLADRVTGVNRAVIQYDGRKWHYVHTHADRDDELPDDWQRTMIVGSTTPYIERGDEITFRIFMRKQGNTLVLTENGVTGHGQHLRNIITYSLRDKDTLVEKEVSTGPLGPRTSVYILERQSDGGSPPEAAAPHDRD